MTKEPLIMLRRKKGSQGTAVEWLDDYRKIESNPPNLWVLGAEMLWLMAFSPESRVYQEFVMSYQQWLQVINSLSGIMWPIVVLCALAIFRTPLSHLLMNVTKGKLFKNFFSFETRGSQQDQALEAEGLRKTQALVRRRRRGLKNDLEEYKNLTKEAEKLLAHEQQFGTSDNAFMTAKDYINIWLDEQRGSQNKKPLVELKLITIAMTFSCRFVTQHLPQIIERNPEASICLQILIVDPLFLDSLSISDHPVRYGETCRDSIRQIRALLSDSARHRGRLSLTLRQYRHLPQWHGLLIGEDHLFLGRSDWRFNENQKPALSVGQNTYRHYGREDPRGQQRICLFQNWHRYFSEFASEEVSLQLNELPRVS